MLKRFTIVIVLLISLENIANSQSNYLYYLLNEYKGNKAILFSTKGSDNTALDTAFRQSTGAFVFTHIEKYPAGMYRVYFNDSLYTEVIINGEDIVIESSASNIVMKMNIKKSIENSILFDYWKFALSIRDSITRLAWERDQIEQATYDSYHPDIIKINNRIEYFNNELYYYVQHTNTDYPVQFAPKLLKSYMVPSMEKFNQANLAHAYTSEKEFYYDHFFDNIDFSDARFVHTKVLFVSISDYMESFGKPASTENYNGIIKQVMTKASANQEVYRYCIDLFMRTFENSIWEDVMVNLIDNYYLKNYVNSPQLGIYYAGLSARIKSLKPGKLAPNIVLPDTSGNIQDLHKTKAKAKMIVFYSSDCSHCAEALPGLIEIYNMYKEQGLEAFGIAIDEDKKLWKNEINKLHLNWINLSDLKSMSSPLINTYNISNTPTIIILNKDNIIMSKPKNLNDIHATLLQLLN